MLPGGLVRTLSELTNELLKHQAHFMVVDRFRAQVGVGDILNNSKKQVRIIQLVHELAELKIFKNLPGIGREMVHVGHQVTFDV